MKKLLLLFTMMMGSMFAFGQAQMVAYIDFTNVPSINYQRMDNNYMFDQRDIKGTFYIDNDVKSAYVIDNVLKQKSKAELRYDAYNDCFELHVNADASEFKHFSKTDRFDFIINNERYVLIETDIINTKQNKTGKGYAVELTSPEANSVLYKRYFKKFEKGVVATSSYNNDIPPSMVSDHFYILKLNNQYVKLDTNKNKLSGIFPKKHQKSIKRFIEEKNFKLRTSDERTEDELIQIVRYSNSL